MEQKNVLGNPSEYSIHEIYNHFSEYEMQYSNILNRRGFFDNYGEGELKLKFVKFLKEYEKTLKNTRGIDSKEMINEILNSVHSLKTVTLTEQRVYGDFNNDAVKYDNNGVMFFDKNAHEAQAFNSIIEHFTNIAFQNKETTRDENIEYKELDKLRNEYIVDKVREEHNYAKGEGVYHSLVKVFGEDMMLNSTSQNINDVKEYLSLHGVDLGKIEQALSMEPNENIGAPSEMKASKFLNLMSVKIEAINEKNKYLAGINKTSREYEKFLQENPQLAKYSEAISNSISNSVAFINNDFNAYFNEKQADLQLILEDFKLPTVEAQNEIKDFIKSLDSMEDISLDLKKQMVSNVVRGVKDFEYKEIDDRYLGVYYSKSKSIEIQKITNASDDKMKESIFHEMMHSASTPRDRLGKAERIGFAEARSYTGAALNEGATELFAQKVFRKSYNDKVGYSYPELVNMTKDMVKLYGEDVYLEAYINGPERLEELMKQDGKSFIEFREITDEFYRYVHMDKEKSSYEIMKSDPKAKELYSNIGNYIEEIKKSRGLKKEKSEWEESMYLFEEEKEKASKGNNFFGKFKEFFSKIKDKFSFKEQQLLLGEGQETQNEFRNAMKIENFQSEFEGNSIQQDTISKESKVNENKEMDDFGER